MPFTLTFLGIQKVTRRVCTELHDVDIIFSDTQCYLFFIG